MKLQGAVQAKHGRGSRSGAIINWRLGEATVGVDYIICYIKCCDQDPMGPGPFNVVGSGLVPALTGMKETNVFNNFRLQSVH